MRNISLRKSLSVDPNYRPAHSNLGAVYRKWENLKNLSVVLKAIKINPKNPNNYFNMGNTLREAERIDDAEYNYKKAIALDPNILGLIII